MNKSNRPQNQHPDALIRSRKDAAQRNYEAVRVTVQAMRRRGMPPDQVTVLAVARESGVSVATIYRRNDLFSLVERVNPDLRRRQTERVYRDEIARLRAELAAAKKDNDYFQNEAMLAKLGSRRLEQENTQLRKKLLEFQREAESMKERIAVCTCESNNLRPLGGSYG
jgi:hypothetical protein